MFFTTLRNRNEARKRMKYEYMKESEQMIQYFQFPKFLLKLRISQNAKFLYMLLYDRARISRKNRWIDKFGNVYLIFPIDELSVQIGKCKSSVKTALKELDDEGLLVRRSGGFSKPNHLYVKIPSDEIGLQTVDDKAVEKMAVIESEKPPSSGHKNGCAGVGNVAPGKRDSCNKGESNEKRKTKEHKKRILNTCSEDIVK